nr:hypothetical protein HmN_000779600 [Hymenolepis microstoma]
MISDFDRANDLPVTQSFDHFDSSSNIYCAAPELQHIIALTTKADIWALGCKITAMVGWSVFKGSSLINVNGFIQWCLTPSYENRPSAEQLKTHRFLQQVNWANIETFQYHISSSSIPTTMLVFKKAEWRDNGRLHDILWSYWNLVICSDKIEPGENGSAMDIKYENPSWKGYRDDIEKEDMLQAKHLLHIMISANMISY